MLRAARAIRNLASEYASRAEAAIARRRAGGAESLVPPRVATAGSAPERSARPFERETVGARYQHGVEIEDRLYNYVLYPGTGDALCVHFSAFFGEWGIDASGARSSRDTFTASGCSGR